MKYIKDKMNIELLSQDKINIELLSQGAPSRALLCLVPCTTHTSLFLASTVSALHRNAHIWNTSHPLLVTYYCRVTVYSPGMEA